MNICIDHQIFSWQRYGGISRYYVMLACELERLGHEVTVPLFFSNNAYLADVPHFACRSFWKNTPFKGRNRLIRLANRYKTKRFLRREKADIVHASYFFHSALPYMQSSASVITMHDMTHERFPNLFSKNDPVLVNKRALVDAADRVIAISEHTKRDLLELYKLPEEKIRVIYHGLSLDVSPKAPDVPLPEYYVLFVGQRYAYKRFRFFLQAMQRIIQEENALHIVAAGGGAFSAEEESFIRELGLEERVHWLQPDDRELAALYAEAALFVFPSLYEGFGLPVLEAFHYDCPVVAADTSSLPEVGGEAALYFHTDDQDSLCQAVKRCLSDQQLRETLQARGRERVQAFSWEKTARATAKLYGEVLDRHQ